MVWGTWQRAQGVALASSLPRSQSDWSSMGCAGQINQIHGDFKEPLKMIWDDRTPDKRWWQPLGGPQREPTISDYTELTKFCHKLIILSFYNINLFRNLISCEVALQRLYRKKRYTNNLELNSRIHYLYLVPDTTGHIQRSCGVHASVHQSCFCSAKGAYRILGEWF